MNHAPDVLTLTPRETGFGWDGVRRLSASLAEHLTGLQLSFGPVEIDDDLAVVGWRAENPHGHVAVKGVESLLIRRGRILIRTLEFARV